MPLPRRPRGSGPSPKATPTPAETATPADRRAPPARTPAETATAPAAEPPPDPLASLDPADRPIAEKLRDALPKSDRLFASRKERIAVEAFYQKRNYQPVWFERGVVSARTNAAVTRIHASSADGLIPAEYKIPEMASAATPDAQAEAELRLTATLITFTRHLQAGRFPFARMGGEIQMPQEPPEVNAALTKLAERDRRRRRDRGVQPAATRLSRAQGQARGAARSDWRRERRSCAFRKARRCGRARKTRASRCSASGSRWQATRPACAMTRPSLPR